MSFNEWREVKLGELIDSISVKHKFDKDKLIFLNTSDILEGEILHNNYSDVKNMPGQAKKSINKGDILFSEIRPKNKRFAYVDFDGEDFVVSTKLMVLRRKNNDIDNKFLYKYLTSEIMLNYLQTMAEGRSGTFPQITFSELKSIDVKLPPIEEQKAIAKILSDLDDKIEVNNKINKRLEDMAQSIFKHWFVNFEFPNEEGKPYKSSGGEMVESELGMIPKGWEVKKIGDIANLTMGVSPTSDSYNYKGEGVPLINGASDFKGKNIEPSKNTTSPKKICELGDLVFGVRATIGNTVFSDDTYAIGRGVASLRALNLIDKEFLYLSLENSMAKLIQNASGSVFLNLKKADISEIKIVYNDYIVKKAHNVLCPIIKKIIKNDKETSKLKELRDTVLPKLMSGEVRVPINKSYR